MGRKSRRKEKERRRDFGAALPYAAVIAVVVAALGLGLSATGFFTATDSELNGFADCLSGEGFVMYGSELCPHCQEQKALFRSSFPHVEYVECTSERELCLQEGIEYLPTWKHGEEKFVGLKSLGELAEISGCGI